MHYFINSQKNNSAKEISIALKKCISAHTAFWNSIIFLCVGTDRATGDCLGPYIGSLLHAFQMDKCYVYGTLSHPIHALNLESTYLHLKKRHPASLTIAIDAALGQKKHLGYITIGNGQLYPGAGVQKELPPIGDIYITGIVNVASPLELLVLQTTRLSGVISMGNQIAHGISNAIPSLSLIKTL